MKNLTVVIGIVLVAGASFYYWQTNKVTPNTLPLDGYSAQSKVYNNSNFGFSLSLPKEDEYMIDESYFYQPTPEKKIGGVKFTIPANFTTGTNLSRDSYLSVEEIAATNNCSADLFLSGSPSPAQIINDNGRQYSVAKLSDAAAGNRYDETVYALTGSKRCVAIRYLIHYGNIANYDPGAIKEFDQAALVSRFDLIRRSLVINQ